jgi:phosphoribosylformylglycinamidine synthase
MGTGLSAKPIANTDVFCVGFPELEVGNWELGPDESDGDSSPQTPNPKSQIPPGVIPPKRTLQRVVDGVRDYGNRMGIPTVNGAVYFHEDYVANPLVYAGCVGIIPLGKCFGDAQPGDRIIILGGATGRDGIHGATFSSAELTDTHADEFSHAVQIGNPITEKKTLDVILRARDYTDPAHPEKGTYPLFSAISDCGAGGFSSAVGEMAEKIGATVTLDTAPTKYDGLTYTEVWISEAQERMPLAVPPENVEALRKLCEAEDVPMCDLGAFGYEEAGIPTLQLLWHGEEVGKLAMAFMHDGIPTPTRTAQWPDADPIKNPQSKIKNPSIAPPLEDQLLTLLSHPNIASKHWIIRQYDHEVQGASVVKPLVGPGQDGPSDGAVLRPKLEGSAGITLSNGLAPYLSEKATADGSAVDGDSYFATLAALDEAVRNAVCVGADPDRLAILDNFCWPRCDDPAQLGSLVRAAEACYDGAMAYQTPFVSGKDSLSNQFTTEDGRLITIPPTLLITALGMIEDVTKAQTMDAKAAGHALLIVGATTPHLGGSHAVASGLACPTTDLRIPRVDLDAGPRNARAVAQLIADRLVASAHDCSEGGLLVAAAEMAFAGRVGLDLDLSHLPPADGELSLTAQCFSETPSRYLLDIAPEHLDAAIRSLRDAGVAFAQIGSFADHADLTLRNAGRGQVMSVPLDTLREAWLAPLDW